MHGSHVTLEAIKQAHEFGLNMVTLPFHTSHALQILDVNFFKPFKNNNNNNAMVKNNHCEPNKCTFAN
jgi:hypothetical protein